MRLLKYITRRTRIIIRNCLYLTRWILTSTVKTGKEFNETLDKLHDAGIAGRKAGNKLREKTANIEWGFQNLCMKNNQTANRNHLTYTEGLPDGPESILWDMLDCPRCGKTIGSPGPNNKIASIELEDNTGFFFHMHRNCYFLWKSENKQAVEELLMSIGRGR